jgi:predicted enzyme related to lactoylglutathione lyase
MIQAIAFTVYPVTDMAKARHFYEEILGLKPAMSVGNFWQEYNLGDNTFGIVAVSEDTPEYFKRKGASIAFEVENLDEALASLKQKGLTIAHGPTDYPTCRMFIVSDPDDNMVTLHQLSK